MIAVILSSLQEHINSPYISVLGVGCTFESPVRLLKNRIAGSHSTSLELNYLDCGAEGFFIIIIIMFVDISDVMGNYYPSQMIILSI